MTNSDYNFLIPRSSVLYAPSFAFASQITPDMIDGFVPSCEPLNPVAENAHGVRLLEPSVGPSGGPVGYNRDGDKVEYVPNDLEEDDQEGPISENILRRNDRAILEAYNLIWKRVWARRIFDRFGVAPSQDAPASNGSLRHTCPPNDECPVCSALVVEDSEFGHLVLVGRLSALAWVLGANWDESSDT